jgi:hypothetical protein
MTPVERTMVVLLCTACPLVGGCGEPPRQSANLGALPAAAASGAEPDPARADPRGDQAAATPAGATPPAWPAGRLDLTFDALKFQMQKDEPFQRGMLTSRIEQLQGRNVRIRGYILPSFQQRGISQFVLVRDNLECCFGPGAALFDCILVEMESGRSISYTVRPVTVTGRFAIREFQGPAGQHLAIYHISGQRVD